MPVLQNGPCIQGIDELSDEHMRYVLMNVLLKTEDEEND